jgi:serine/threonine-protein kinase
MPSRSSDPAANGGATALDRALERFEQAWQAGARPRVEDYLPGGRQTLAVLLPLVHVDLERRLTAGQPARVEDYLARFPVLAGSPEALVELAEAEYRLRHRADPKLRADEYLARFPSLADRLRPRLRAKDGGEAHPLAARPAQAATLAAVSGLPPGDRSAHPDPVAPAEPVPMTAILEVLAGPHAGAIFTFGRHDTFVIGRAESAHLCVRDDRHFSRHHLLLEFNPPRCYLRDLGSRNGTFVNDNVVKEAFLKSGDVISAGRTRIRYHVQTANGQYASKQVTCICCSGTAPLETLLTEGEPANTVSYVCAACRQKVQEHPQPLPGYELLRLLGKGGMGMVYLGRHLASGRPVAIKLVVPESAASTQAAQLFLREISIMSQLRHPRIVRFHEAGMSHGQFFIVMDYVETVDVGAHLAQQSGAGLVKVVCGILCQVLDGLRYAHERAIVHRDVKPPNILVSKAGRKLRSKLSDFGLAKNFENAGFSGMTREGEIRGSLPFMAPEQVMCCRDAKPAADVYSAGATLYYFLTKHTPHDFSTTKDGFAVVLEDDIVPIHERCPHVPPGLVQTIYRAMAKKPGDRFESAQEMREQLLPFAKGLSASS